MRITTAERVRRLEDELEYVKAIVDGSDMQTREAVVCVLGLLMAFLKQKGLLDHGELISYLAESADANEETEDHNGKLIHDVRRIVEFHRDLEAGTLKPYVPLRERLAADEIAAIRARAKAQVVFERAAKDAADAGKGRKRKGARQGGEPPRH